MRGAFGYDVKAASDAARLVPSMPSRVKPEFAEDCDINVIVRRFGLTGQVPANVRMPLTGDFSAALDFHSANNLVLEARDSFDRLPGDLRKRFGFDPGRLMEFLEDPSNRAEAVSLGLVDAPPAVPAEPAVPASGS